MAYITPVSGGAQPVFATDVRNPVAAGASTAATPVNFQGPKLDFYRVVANTSVATQQDVNEYVSNVIQAIQQTATVAIYQVAATGNATNFSVATYPTGAFNTATNGTDNSAATLQAIIQALGTVSGYDLSGATVTNVGFRLASTATNAS